MLYHTTFLSNQEMYFSFIMYKNVFVCNFDAFCKLMLVKFNFSWINTKFFHYCNQNAVVNNLSTSLPANEYFGIVFPNIVKRRNDLTSYCQMDC